MIVKTILGNIKNYDLDGKTIDRVNISPDDRLKKIVRLKSDSGVEIGISLDDDVILHNGDILAKDERRVFVLNCLPQEVLIIKPKDITQMGVVAHSIGNRHIPAIFENGEMIIENDYLIVEWLDKSKVEYEVAKKVLHHPLKHASHHH